ncbi:hypothetical protein E8E11_002678 [Didymella keratinophila]|nr:hypothetical protein E8E11_002678 [Didymella keratinophila]
MPHDKVFSTKVLSIRLFNDKGHKKYQREAGTWQPYSRELVNNRKSGFSDGGAGLRDKLQHEFDTSGHVSRVQVQTMPDSRWV